MPICFGKWYILFAKISVFAFVVTSLIHSEGNRFSMKSPSFVDFFKMY